MERATLRAILFADLHQYSRLVAEDEAATLAFVSRCFDLFREHCARHGGEFVKTTGDGALLLFDSASVAVEFAMTLQAEIRSLPQRPTAGGLFRIGLHMGEVLKRGGDVYGHAVNLAARIEAEAEPGGVCVTHEVYRAVQPSSRYGFRFGGRAALKNMPEPVALYHVVLPEVAGAAPSARLRISVVDGISLATEEGEPVPLRSLPARALVGYVALAGRRGDPLERAAALIWPLQGSAAAHRALARCVRTIEAAAATRLRQGLLRHGDLVGFIQSRAEVDLLRLLDDLRKGRVDELLLERADWPESILRGLDQVGPSFRAWLRVARHNWRERVGEVLEANLDRFQVGEPALRNAAAALLRLEPSHERAARQLIRHHAAVGNIPAAMSVYENLRRLLRGRFKLTPSRETDELVRTLSAPAPATPAGPRRFRRARGPVIGIGPFQARADRLTHAATGFRADLIANLSKFRELTIVEVPAGVEGRGLDYLLTGECIPAADEASLALRLAAIESGRVIWSNSCGLTMAGWAGAQQMVVREIASEVEIYLSQDRLSRTLLGTIEDLGSYDAWLRGEQLLTRWSPTEEDEAAALFADVIAGDPEFSPAHASLASVHTSRHLIRVGTAPEPALLQAALGLARRAVELDPLDARNHIVLAWSEAMLGHFEQSEVHYELASELNPNSPRTLVSAALGLAFMGRREDAARLLDHATALTSLFLDYQWSHIATIRFLSGDLSGCIQAAERSNNRIVDTPGWKAAALQRLGRPQEARVALAQLYDVVRAAWEGPAPCTPERALAWFQSAFPIRREEDRRWLLALGEVGIAEASQPEPA